MNTRKLVALICLIMGLAEHAGADCNPDIIRTKPNAIYINHGDGTVTDIETGLMWMQCTLGLSGADCATGSPSYTNWRMLMNAAQSANDSNSLGYSDWRLPNIKELATLIERACDPAINTSFFPNLNNVVFWSSSPGFYPTNTKVIQFSDGQNYESYQVYGFNVRLVRDAE